MHKQGYLHRDICPRNVMVTTKDDVVKLIDFGLTIPYRRSSASPATAPARPTTWLPK